DREAWQQLFERTAHAEALLKLLQVKCISLLLESKNLTEIGNFWPILIEELTEKLGSENQVVKWLHTLPASLQQRFIQRLLKTHGYPVTALSQPLLVSEAFNLGLQEGYLSHLKSEQPVIMRDKDLRGIDLSALDLTNIELINCDLRLTGIFKNKTITKAHIEENRLDKKFFIQLFLDGNIEAIKLALSSTKAFSLFDEKYKGMNIFSYMGDSEFRRFHGIDRSIWRQLVYHIYQALIESPYFTPQYLARSGVLSSIVKYKYADLMRTFIESPKCSTEAFKRVIESSYQLKTESTILYDIISGLSESQADKQVLLTMADMVLQSSHMKPEILLVKHRGYYDALTQALSLGQTEMILKILNSPCCNDVTVRTAMKTTDYLMMNYKAKGYWTLLNNYINPPPSYQAIYQKTKGSEFNKACALLSDYTKGGSAALRFFCGHWNRHYIKEVGQILQQVKSGQLSTLDELITALHQINPTNKTGSLTARTLFIVREQKKTVRAPEVAPEPSGYRL
ncbi:DUF5617 domain-containing protein, partial [Legionella dresdenensis]